MRHSESGVQDEAVAGAGAIVAESLVCSQSRESIERRREEDVSVSVFRYRASRTPSGSGCGSLCSVSPREDTASKILCAPFAPPLPVTAFSLSNVEKHNTLLVFRDWNRTGVYLVIYGSYCSMILN